MDEYEDQSSTEEDGKKPTDAPVKEVDAVTSPPVKVKTTGDTNPPSQPGHQRPA